MVAVRVLEILVSILGISVCVVVVLDAVNDYRKDKTNEH